MITFESGLDARTRAPSRPTVARFATGNPSLPYAYIAIGTDYGHLHTAAGDVRTWCTYSGAYKAAKRYQPL